MPYATVPELVSRWRPLTTEEQTRATALLEDASDMVREVPGVPARIASGLLAATTLTRIVVGMVKRAMIAGDLAGIQSQSQAAGPFSVTMTAANPTGDLYLTSANRQALGGRRRRAFAVDL